MEALVRAIIDATDKSISPEMIRYAMAMAIIAISAMDAITKLRFEAVAKYSEA
jgi:hypothetical protein